MDQARYHFEHTAWRYGQAQTIPQLHLGRCLQLEKFKTQLTPKKCQQECQQTSSGEG